MFSSLIDLQQTVLSTWRLRTDRSVRAAIHGWCLRELAGWTTDGCITVDDTALAAINATQPWSFLFSIGPGGATVLPKPAGIDTAGDAARHRVQHYRQFLDRIARKARLSRPITIAIDVNDGPISSGEVPIFSFQKRAGSNNILIPDIDFLVAGRHSLPCWLTFDRVAWRRKRHSAAFTGSTTGGLITADIVRSRSLPRLRAERFFRDKPNVIYRLTNIVDCDRPETEAMLREAGVGKRPLPWRDLFRHRFLISMDGNGATCSRVVIGLRSRSVLLKYESDCELYYFRALEPWRHYVPIREDEDVLRTLSLAAGRLGLFRDISAAGQRFARVFLTRRAVEFYMAELLSMYASMLQPTGHAAPKASKVHRARESADA